MRDQILGRPALARASRTYPARRQEPARLLLLGTYRPPDALHRGHPLAAVHHELQRHGQCTELPLSLLSDPASVLLAYVSFYDQRGGGVETSFKGDRQGLGIGKRSKKRFTAQQVVMLLGSLAHNVIVWARHWLASPSLHHYGTLRMVRDVFHISGFLLTDASGRWFSLCSIRLLPWHLP